MTHSTTREPSLSLPRSVPPPSAPELAPEAPLAEHFESSIRHRLALLVSLTATASDASRSPLARREAARLASATATASAQLLAAWQEEADYAEGGDRLTWQSQALDAIGDALARVRAQLALVVAELPAAPAPLARTVAPAPASRRAGGAA